MPEGYQDYTRIIKVEGGFFQVGDGHSDGRWLGNAVWRVKVQGRQFMYAPPNQECDVCISLCTYRDESTTGDTIYGTHQAS